MLRRKPSGEEREGDLREADTSNWRVKVRLPENVTLVKA